MRVAAAQIDPKPVEPARNLEVWIGRLEEAASVAVLIGPDGAIGSTARLRSSAAGARSSTRTARGCTEKERREQ